MKTFGIILIVVGIAMIIFRGFNVTTTKNVVDAGPIKIDKQEDNWIGWPSYAGAAIAVIGVVLIVVDKRK